MNEIDWRAAAEQAWADLATAQRASSDWEATAKEIAGHLVEARVEARRLAERATRAEALAHYMSNAVEQMETDRGDR